MSGEYVLDDAFLGVELCEGDVIADSDGVCVESASCFGSVFAFECAAECASELCVSVLDVVESGSGSDDSCVFVGVDGLSP